jgi:hypothetical protein
MPYLLFEQNFTSTDSIHVQHNQNREVGVRVVIGGESRQDLIDTIELDSGDPYNGLTINLKSVESGHAQILDSQIFQDGSYLFWQRDVDTGVLFPTSLTDDIAVGGYLSPAGKWFQDGALVLGGDAMAGAEKLRVIGSHLIDQNGNAVGLDIDSEATSYPLINLQGLNGNSRGDIAFGIARTGDPSAPSEGDLWYESTGGELKFRKSAASVKVRNAIELQGHAIAAAAPANQNVLAWDGTAAEWKAESLSNLPGPYSDQATATGLTTTTSTTDVAVAGMTITPPAGKYAVWFSSFLQHSNNNRTINISIYAGGTQYAYSERMAQMSQWNNVALCFATNAIVTVNGTQAIDVRWRTNGGTASMLNRSMLIVRVS